MLEIAGGIILAVLFFAVVLPILWNVIIGVFSVFEVVLDWCTVNVVIIVIAIVIIIGIVASYYFGG